MLLLQLLDAEDSKQLSSWAEVGQGELRTSLRVRVAVSRVRASACVGVLRAREVCVRMDMCGVFCCGGSWLQRPVRARSCAIRAWA
eukprot:5451527-Prymnesium_polylepis.1